MRLFFDVALSLVQFNIKSADSYCIEKNGVCITYL